MDAGCGSGAYLTHLKKEGYEIIGLDFSGSLLRELRYLWQKGGEDANLKLCQGDIQNIPLSDASMDLIFSFATFYHVPNVKDALCEFQRILRPKGRAVLEFGNLKSLNNIEAKRCETGVISYHLPLSKIKNLLREYNFRILEHRCFQIFPMYGGCSPFVAQVLNPILRERLARKKRGKMLDEWVSSSPIAREFAFRHLFVLEKEKSAVESEVRYEISSLKEALSLAPERQERREAAVQLLIKGNYHEGIHRLLDMLEEVPEDFFVVCILAQLFDAPEERSFVSRTFEPYYLSTIVKRLNEKMDK